MAGDADTALAIHRLLEQFGKTREQVGQLGKTLLQLGAQFDQVLGHHTTDEAVTRTLAALHVLAGLEVGQLFAGAEHELLLRPQIARQLRHGLDQAPQIAWQRMLGQQLGQVLLDLPQPVGGGAQTREMGEVADGLVRQVVAFVEHVDGVARVGQHRAAPQRQVRQHHVVVGDDHIDLGHAFTRLVEGALLEIRAMPTGTLAVIGGQPRPVRVGQLFRPGIAIAVPAIAGEFFDHAAEQFLTALVDIEAKALLFEELRGGALRLTFLQQRVELGQAQIAPPPLCQGEAEVEPAVAHQVGQILVDDLLLQRHCRRGDHQALAGRLGRGNRGQAIGHGFTRTGTRLHRDHRGLAVAAAFVVGLDRAQDLGHFGNHQPLPIARLEALGLEETRVGALDLGFEFGAEHERRAVYIFSISKGGYDNARFPLRH